MKAEIEDILADLEAKAKQVGEEWVRRIQDFPGTYNVVAYADACSPDRILAVVAWVKEVALPIIRTMAGNEPVSAYGGGGAESGMRGCFACGVETPDDGTPFPHDADCAHLVAQKTLAGHLDAGEEEKRYGNQED